MAFLFIVFIVGMAIATFVENDYGSETAYALFYDATWFELILVLGAINILLVIIRHKVYKKPTVFLFHISIIIIIIGAGITRYYGFEGTMHIREGRETSRVLTEKTYVNIMLDDLSDVKTISKEVILSGLKPTNFHEIIEFGDKFFEFSFADYIPYARPTITPAEKGIPVIELVTANEVGRDYIVLAELNKKAIGDIVFNFKQAYFQKHLKKTVWLRMAKNKVYFWAPFPVQRTDMMQGVDTVLPEGQLHEFIPLQLHNFQGNRVVLNKYFESGFIDAVGTEDQNLSDAVKINVKYKGDQMPIVVYGKKGELGASRSIEIEGINVFINYGANIVKLPFALKLNDFILKRYPGSGSPSWYESKVELIDESKNMREKRRIYMNHTLKYRGFKFFQSSYDPDEKGTILSVNYDKAGTTVTYLGYLLLALGMLLSLFFKNTRFRKLLSGSHTARIVMLMIVLQIPLNAFTQDRNDFEKHIIPKSQAEKFGKLAVQDIQGRIKPVNSLSSEVLRKIARKNIYQRMNADQVFLSMMIYPEFWQNQPVIKAGHPAINAVLKKGGKYLSFNDFFSDSLYTDYLLSEAVLQAHQKKPAYRSKADNELIKIDERVSICYMVYSTRLLRIFPNTEDTTNRWYSPVTAINSYSGKDSAFTQNGIAYYAELVRKANTTGNWEKASEILDKIRLYQINEGSHILPVKQKLQIEIVYNKTDIFNRLSNYYLMLGLLLFVLQLVAMFTRVKLKTFIRVLNVLLFVLFGLHTLGLGLRWYISGHAPWSNGYEALIFISWAAVLAGILFSKKLTLTLSLTALLASLILTTAHLSWMDPQITLLQPVLKSYWLVIHVAVITGSYGFLALGTVLAVLNLFFLFFETNKNTNTLRPNIELLSNIIELTLTVGLYMLAIGTFLGGVWANESWGRYWGWDPKETWALISIVVYAYILHTRLLPSRLKKYMSFSLFGQVGFNSLVVIGFATIIMTYFGVNYYLSGLHSYAAGDPLPIPMFVYFTVPTWLLISLLAGIHQHQLHKKQTGLNEKK